MITSLVDRIANHKLFIGLTADELTGFLNPGQYRLVEYDRSQIIHLQNEICLAMDIILDGKVSVQKIDENGNVLKIAEFRSGDILGANLIFAHRNTYPMSVTAESATLVLHLSKSLILALCQHNQPFMIALMTEISDRTLVLTDKIDAISLKTIKQSVIEFLTYEYYRQKNTTIRLPLSKKELADRLGVQRTSLSRELDKMRKQGLIDFNARTITIKDLKILPGRVR